MGVNRVDDTPFVCPHPNLPPLAGEGIYGYAKLIEGRPPERFIQGNVALRAEALDSSLSYAKFGMPIGAPLPG